MAMLTSHYLEVEQGLGGSHAATNPGHRGPALPPLLPGNIMITEYVYKYDSGLLVSEVERAFERAGRVRSVV